MKRGGEGHIPHYAKSHLTFVKICAQHYRLYINDAHIHRNVSGLFWCNNVSNFGATMMISWIQNEGSNLANLVSMVHVRFNASVQPKRLWHHKHRWDLTNERWGRAVSYWLQSLNLLTTGKANFKSQLTLKGYVSPSSGTVMLQVTTS